MAFTFANNLSNTTKTSTYFPTGNQVGIAFLDTGISPTTDFTQPYNRIIAFKDFINNKNKPYDDNGHCTHVTGIPCGNGILSNEKHKGLAHKSNIISLKILDSSGQGTSSHAISALVWIFDNAHKYNIKVVNLSIGSNDRKVNYPLKASVEALWNRGIVVVAAAANPDGRKDFVANPPLSPKIITVGAWEDASFFSTKCNKKSGSSPNLYAPGENIISVLSPHYRFSLPNRSQNNVRDNYYISMSGASMATPFISGVVSLILEKNPYLTPNEVKNILIRMSNDNHGYIDRDYCLRNL